MKVELLHHTPLKIASIAIRKCWASEDKSDTIKASEASSMKQAGECLAYDYLGEKDKELIHRVGNKNKHSSTLEHLNYSFDIDAISRACLQELARHRMASISVKSTRYTLKELKSEYNFIKNIPFGNEYDIERAKKYLVLPPHANRYDKVWQKQIKALEELREELIEGKDSNDVVKYLLPESYKTSLVWTINARSLQNFLALRTSKSALWEIRDLAKEVFKNLPDEHKYLFEDFVYKESE